MSKWKCPQTEIRCCIWNATKHILNSLDQLMDKNLTWILMTLLFNLFFPGRLRDGNIWSHLFSRISFLYWDWLLWLSWLNYLIIDNSILIIGINLANHPSPWIISFILYIFSLNRLSIFIFLFIFFVLMWVFSFNLTNLNNGFW